MLLGKLSGEMKTLDTKKVRYLMHLCILKTPVFFKGESISWIYICRKFKFICEVQREESIR